MKTRVERDEIVIGKSHFNILAHKTHSRVPSCYFTIKLGREEEKINYKKFCVKPESVFHWLICLNGSSQIQFQYNIIACIHHMLDRQWQEQLSRAPIGST